MASDSPSLSLSQWLARLEALHPTEIELGLDRVRTVARRLPIRPAAKVVTVAGTNGKGSFVATLEALCLGNKATVGAYTSPHFLHYNERVRINGEMATDAELVGAFEQIEAARGAISLTYFEFGTLAALLLFSAVALDYWILEVGLGGRLDAVNIIDPDIAVVTSIDLDHQAWLGETREAIGAEKAGIFRPGKPAICVDENPPESVLQAGANTRLLLAGRDLSWREEGTRWNWQGSDPSGKSLSLTHLPLPALPLASVAAALEAATLSAMPLAADVVAQSLQRLQLTGRRQRLNYRGTEVLLDVAHNPAAARHLAAALAGEGKSVIAVFAVMADKDYAAMLAALQPLVSRWFMGGLPDNPRAASVGDLASLRRRLGLPGEECDTVRECFERAIAHAGAGDLVLVWGSFYTVADVLTAMHDTTDN